jgi:hypothetical protein
LRGFVLKHSSRILDDLDFVRRQVIEAIDAFVDLVLPDGGTGFMVGALGGETFEGV